MKKLQKKKPKHDKSILSEINDNPDPKVKVSPADKEKGILSELNDDPGQKSDCRKERKERKEK
jgi:hypothetical protein